MLAFILRIIPVREQGSLAWVQPSGPKPRQGQRQHSSRAPRWHPGGPVRAARLRHLAVVVLEEGLWSLLRQNDTPVGEWGWATCWCPPDSTPRDPEILSEADLCHSWWGRLAVSSKIQQNKVAFPKGPGLG